MLTAISSFKATATSKKMTESKKNYNSVKAAISFKGFPTVGLKNENKLAAMAGKFLEETRGFLKRSLTKITKQNELPISERPLIAPTSMDPLAHLSKEELAKLGQPKNPIQRTLDVLGGHKEAQGEASISSKAGKFISEMGQNASEAERPIDLRHSQFDSQGNLTYIVREGDADAPALSKLAAHLSSVEENPVTPTHLNDIVWGSDGQPLHVLSDADKALTEAGTGGNSARLSKLMSESEQLPKELQAPVKAENLVFDGDGNLVYTIPEETHPPAHELPPQHNFPDTDLDFGADWG